MKTIAVIDAGISGLAAAFLLSRRHRVDLFEQARLDRAIHLPGGELASVGEILKSLARTTSLSLYHAENCGRHPPAAGEERSPACPLQ